MQCVALLLLTALPALAGCGAANDTTSLASAADSTELAVLYDPAVSSAPTIALSPTSQASSGACLAGTNLAATQDGAPIVLDPAFTGGRKLSFADNGVICGSIQFDSASNPPASEASTVFRVSDGTTTWTVIVENMGAKRSVAPADPTQVIHPGDRVVLTWSPATDVLDVSSARVAGFGGGLDTPLSLTGSSLSFVVPDAVPAGAPSLTIEGALVQPSISQCSGPDRCTNGNPISPALDGFVLTIAQ
jgi:hypothetical protein